ncbi:NADH-quinone oxidoreductase subunit J family protein [Schlesneria sp.]|uniref:NADH-quinone oxidoreductase subunit J family protein n=1 Tax=Schlesneria sp. TaxID=2762018 RepID=UPI002EE58AFC
MIEQLLFYTFAFLACGGAIAVAASQNVVRMAFWLVVSLGSVAALFFLLHADFLGAAQLLIYVGGTVVLLVFGVMLTASGPYSTIKTSPAEGIMGAAVGVLLLFVLISSIGYVDWADITARSPTIPAAPVLADLTLGAHAEEVLVNTGSTQAKADLEARVQQGRTIRQLGMSFLGMRVDRNLAVGGAQGLAPGYFLPFEIVSVHLLVVLIGAAYLARAKRRAVSEEAVSLE